MITLDKADALKAMRFRILSAAVDWYPLRCFHNLFARESKILLVADEKPEDCRVVLSFKNCRLSLKMG